jgi:hypothetical protein
VLLGVVEQHRLGGQLDARVRALGGVDGELGEPQGQRRGLGHVVDDGMGRRQQVPRLRDAADQPGGQRLGGGQAAPGEQQLLGEALADQLGQPVGGSGPGQDAQPHLRLAEERPVRAHPDVAGVGQLGAAAQRGPVHRRHRGQRQRPDPGEQAGVDGAQGIGGVAVAKLGDVGARGEGALVAAGEHQQPGPGLQCGAHAVQVVHHGLVDGVALVGAVQRDDQAVVALVHQQGVEIHGFTFSPSIQR